MKRRIPVLMMAALFIFYLFALCVFIPSKYNIETNGFCGLMCIYVLAGTISAVMLCELPSGKFAFPLIFISAWMTDACAYGVGRKLGKHKLCPTISPKKSVEGALGGIAGNVIGFIIYAVIIQIFTQTTPKYIALIITAIGLSVISQLGDLIMSLVKRRFGIKDYGKLLGSHGGILDRIDSILFTSVCMAIIMEVIAQFL